VGESTGSSHAKPNINPNRNATIQSQTPWRIPDHARIPIPKKISATRAVEATREAHEYLRQLHTKTKTPETMTREKRRISFAATTGGTIKELTQRSPPRNAGPPKQIATAFQTGQAINGEVLVPSGRPLFMRPTISLDG
jgi:hypothetical protein